MFFLMMYYTAINAITAGLFFIDKRRAIQHQWRISETTLLTCSAIGGALGGLVMMSLIRHKTQKWRFKLGLPLLLIIQLLLILQWYSG